MKIGILTLYYKNNNYGGQLQSFALQKKIYELGFDCEQICFDNEYKSWFYVLLRDVKHSKPKELPLRLLLVIKYLCQCLVLIKDCIYLNKRKDVFSYFSGFVPHSANVYCNDTVNELNKYYDKFVVGSDCVWHIYENDCVYGLAFVDDNKSKISYAASLGCMHIPAEWNEKFLDKVGCFDSISVREKSIADELQQLISEKDIHNVTDPTLLFTAEEWCTYLSIKSIPQKYALIYILSEDKSQCKKSEKWAHSLGLKTYVFPHIHSTLRYWQKNFGDFRDFTSGPFDFITLIKNADVIITDSFHATVFSAIFHKPFFALERETETEYIGRVENFLSDIGLSSQLIDTDKLLSVKEIPSIDFSDADRIIEEKRKISIKFLEESIK